MTALSGPGIYIVSLNNEHPISVNADRPGIAGQCISVTRANCKFGKAFNLEARRRDYYRTFGQENVNFYPIAAVEDPTAVEVAVLARLATYRVRGQTGRLNEWLWGIRPKQVQAIILEVLGEIDCVHQQLGAVDTRSRSEEPPPRKAAAQSGPRGAERYAGRRYRVTREPASLVPQNQVSWQRIGHAIEQSGGGSALFEVLCAAVAGHESAVESEQGLPPNQIAARFVMYCIRRGWLNDG